MKHGQKAPRNPLFTDKKSADIFIALFIEEHHKRIAKSLFVDGLTNEETAYKIGYSTRQIERIKTYLLRAAVKRLIEKQIPQAINEEQFVKDMNIYYNCPVCDCDFTGKPATKYCSNCGQALDWSDTE